jgi:DNA-binding response OmpR family regulator
VSDSARILVVDDTPENVLLLSAVLEKNGYEVVTASSGLQALQRVGTERPDLVLLDVVMPQMSGYEVCRKIREDPATGVLPVVMVTALDPGQERIKGLEAGADDFLTKPINQPELLARVRSLLRIKHLYDTVDDLARQLAETNRTLEARVTEQVAQLERLSRLKRFFAADLAEMIVAGDADDPLKSHRREITVVFLDLRGFTAFGELTAKWQKLGYELSIGVGIAQGYATLGAIGFEGRLDYGAIGTVTNLAARLCGEAKQGEILISRRLMSTLETLIETKAVGEVTLKGFAKPVTAFNVVGLTVSRA